MSDSISKCIACDSSNFKYYAENTTLKFPIHICQECHLHVAGESQEQLDNIVKEFYKQDFWDIERDRELNDEHDDQYSIGRKRLFSSQIKYIQKHISKNSKILEIGSCHGEALIQFEKSSNFSTYCLNFLQNKFTFSLSLLRSFFKDEIYLSSFGEDGLGELYFLNHTGSIYKLIGIK